MSHKVSIKRGSQQASEYYRGCNRLVAQYDENGVRVRMLGVVDSEVAKQDAGIRHKG